MRRLRGMIPPRWAESLTMLRTRLFLNLVPFVVILFAVGVYAIVLFSRMADHIDLVVMKNYRSVTAVQRMDLALANMHSGVILIFEQNAQLGRSMFDDGATRFQSNLRLQLRNISLNEEKHLSGDLANKYLAYFGAGTNLFARPDRDFYADRYYPALSELTALLGKIRTMNHDAILRTNESAARIAREVTGLMLAGMIVALGVASYACYHLGRTILNPIQSLTRATRELAAGGDVRPVPVPAESQDELAVLAGSFNRMAEQLQDYRRSTSDELLRLHRTMEVTLASFPDPLFVLDRRGDILLRNPAAEDLEKKLHLQGGLPEPLDRVAGDVLSSGESFVPQEYGHAVPMRIGEEDKWFLPRVLAMTAQDRSVMGVAVVLYDITRFRLLDDLKTNLTATVSHEIKTPLTSIRMVLHLLLDRGLDPLTPRQEELVLTARDEVERLLRILNDLLDLARLEGGSTELNKEPVAPQSLLDMVKAEFTESAAGRGLSLVCQQDGAVPRVFVDVQRIRHVFTNLVGNAVKHSPEGGRITLKATLVADRWVRFSVADQGPGIPEEYQNRVFERFFRVQGQNHTGAGLGLSIAREIVLAHGGRIGVNQGQPGGSEFFFVLPGEPRDV